MFELYNNTMFDFMIAGLILIIIISAGTITQKVLIRRLERGAKKSKTLLDDAAVVALQSFGIKFYIILAILVSIFFFLNTPEAVSGLIRKTFVIFIGLSVGIMSFRLITFFTTEYAKNLRSSQKNLATALPTVGTLLKILASLLIFTSVLSNIGISVTPLIAGLGIGGLAVAFAFQKILADLFSSFVIFFDKPFAEGDVIEYGTTVGTVERVGVKTTRIRAFTGEIVITPNEQLVSQEIKNITARSERKVQFTIPISYDTSPKDLEKVPGILEKVITESKKTIFGHTKIKEFGSRAIIFDVVYKLKDATFDEHINTRHLIHAKSMKQLQGEKISLGHPVKCCVTE